MPPRDFAFWEKSLKGQQAKQKKKFFFFNENVRALKNALEHLNAGESTLRRFLTSILSKNSKFLKAREIIILWTKRALNHCLISLVTNWLRLSISRKIPGNVPGLYRPTFHLPSENRADTDSQNTSFCENCQKQLLESLVLLKASMTNIHDSWSFHNFHVIYQAWDAVFRHQMKHREESSGVFFRGTQQRLLENISSEDDLRSRIFGTFVVKFLACLPLLGFSSPPKKV